MATAGQQQERAYRIVAGPCKYELLILALGEGRTVEFSLEGQGRVTAFVASVLREDGSNQSWCVNGAYVGIADRRVRFSACYHTRRRQGVLKAE